MQKWKSVHKCAAKSPSLEPSYPSSNFTPSHDWNIFSSRKKNTFVSRKQILLILLEIRIRPFATRILSFTAMAGSTTCGRHHVFARFLRIFQELSFVSHMRSSWDLPFASSIKTGHHKLNWDILMPNSSQKRLGRFSVVHFFQITLLFFSMLSCTFILPVFTPIYFNVSNVKYV